MASSSSSSSSSLVNDDIEDEQLNTSPTRESPKRLRCDTNLDLVLMAHECIKEYNAFMTEDDKLWTLEYSTIVEKFKKQREEAFCNYLTSRVDYQWLACASVYFKKQLQEVTLHMPSKAKVHFELLPGMERFKAVFHRLHECGYNLNFKQTLDELLTELENVKKITDCFTSKELFEQIIEVQKIREDLSAAEIQISKLEGRSDLPLDSTAKRNREIFREIRQKESEFHEEYKKALESAVSEARQKFGKIARNTPRFREITQKNARCNKCPNCGQKRILSRETKESDLHGQLVYENGVATDVIFSCSPSDQSSPKRNH